MNFCSNCGSDALDFVIPEGDNRARHVCKQCMLIHYSNPKIVAGCLPIWEDKVLLAKRAIEPRKGFWNVTSGYLENGETVEQGALREVWEEAKARPLITGLHAVYSIPHINQIYIHFLAELQTPEYGVGEESLEVDLFAKEDIPWSEIAFTSSLFTLSRFFQDRDEGKQQVHMGKYQP